MAERISFGDTLILKGEKLLIDNGTNDGIIKSKNGTVKIDGNITVTGTTSFSGGVSGPLGGLTDVSSTAATTGQVLKWSGSEWAPGTDDNSGGGSSYSDTDVATYLGGNLDTHILPDTNDTYDIGSATHKIRDLYVSDNSIHIGDNTLRTSGGNLLLNGEDVMDYANFKSKPTIPTALSELTNDSGFISSVPAQSFASLTNTPTTLAGYGITDATATTHLTYDSATKSVISEDVSSGGGGTDIVENFTNVSTPVNSVTLATNMSQYITGDITVGNGVDASYVLSTSDYTYLNNVITFNTPIADGQVTYTANITTTSVNSSAGDIISINGVNITIENASETIGMFSNTQANIAYGHDGTGPNTSWTFSDGTTSATVDVANNVNDMANLASLINQISFMEAVWDDPSYPGKLRWGPLDTVQQLTYSQLRNNNVTATSVYDAIQPPSNYTIRNQINAVLNPGIVATASSSNTLTIASTTVSITLTEVTAGAMSRLGFSSTTMTSFGGVGDQDGQVDIEVELLSTIGYANLGTSTKAFKSLYVDNIHVTNETLVTLSTLKSVVAASTDFADFKSRIAAL